MQIAMDTYLPYMVFYGKVRLYIQINLFDIPRSILPYQMVYGSLQGLLHQIQIFGGGLDSGGAMVGIHVLRAA